MSNKTRIFIASELMYLVVSMSTVVVGTNLTSLTVIYNQPLSKIVLFSSAFACGRIFSSSIIAKIANKYGVKPIMIAGNVFVALYVFGIVTTDNYYLGLVLSTLGGVGQGSQDVATTTYLSQISGDKYSRNMSLGQCLYAAGCFITPFFVSMLLKANLPFYYSNYVMLIFPLILLFLAIGIKKEKGKKSEEEESITPIYVNNKKLAILLVGMICTFSTCLLSGINTYTTTYLASVGVSDGDAALLLSIYNIGCMIGALFFAPFVGKYKVTTVYKFLLVAGIITVLGIIIVNDLFLYYILYFICGFFTGDIYALVIIIATSVWYNNVAFASSFITIAGGLCDMLFPPVVGKVIERLGTNFSMYYIILAATIALLAGIGIEKISEK